MHIGDNDIHRLEEPRTFSEQNSRAKSVHAHTNTFH